MPRLALLICVVWFFALFVYRSWLQWRKTGSTGFKGFHGPVGSLPWLGGAMVGLGMVGVPLAPVATLAGWPGSAVLLASPGIHALGAVLALAGTAGTLAAQLAMGDSWRVGVDEKETTELVTGGLFAWVRNPIFSFTFLSLAGLVLLVPSPWAGAATLLTFAGIQIQVRHVEEPYLARTHGPAYAHYAATVGRFFPGLGLLR